MPPGIARVEYPLMQSPLGEVKRVLKIVVFYVALPLFLAPSCKPKHASSDSGPDLRAPSGLTASTVSKTQIDLAWTNLSVDATGLEIERSVNGGAFAPLATLAANATSYSDMGLTASTEYSYQIRAVMTGQTGPFTTPPASASTVVALYEAVKSGKIKKGDNVVLVAFGGGLTWAATAIRW